ncbi:ComEC/Rec2 family competence protein [Paenibacillus sp. GCM10012307]|uniref:ComEC/Rec2 family competence protein n=1 Tax=Paenibacillus roseus TaxID=2798579 RepID=A0A934J575_9BACL|nr:ComEC/Rec2 family competence protein [Paenibacillus roseus]MBJ6363075.1 ComEC/Rec2 family competence protein [Paenibacillus roseus]
MSKRPLVWFVVCWVAGSAAAASLTSSAVLLLGIALAFFLAGLALLGYTGRRLAFICLAAFALAVGERTFVDMRNVTALEEFAGEAVEARIDASFTAGAKLTGTIVSPVAVDGDRASFHILVSLLNREKQPREMKERMLVQVKLFQEEEREIAAGWRRGDQIEVSGELQLPAEATNFGGFDYRRYLHSKRIHWLFKVQGAQAISTRTTSNWTLPAMLGTVDQARGWLAERLDRLYSGQHAGYMKGLVIGMREDMDPAQFQQFSGLGMSHILAISGLHVGVFLYGLTLAMRLFRMTKESTMNVLIVAVPIYVLLAGATPSVTRAGLMAVIGLIAAKRHMLKDGLHILAFAGLAMLIVEPYMLENVSFQFSFLVTAGLILGVPRLRRALPDWKRGRWVLDMTAVSIVAELISFPLTIYYFNTYNLLSLPANLLLVPVISSVSLPLGTVSLLLSLIWQPLGEAAAWLARITNTFTFTTIESLDQISITKLIWPSPSIGWMAVWFVAVLVGIYLLAAAASLRRQLRDEQAGPKEQADHSIDGAAVDLPTQPLGLPLGTGKGTLTGTGYSRTTFRNRRIQAAALAVLIIVMLVYAYSPGRWDKAAVVQFLDVGQGDAILIRTPQNAHILVDGGGTVKFRKNSEEWRERRDPFEVGRKVVVPLLKKRGVQKIDLLVISHLDTDHIGGLQAVIETIPIRKIVWNGTIKPSSDARVLLATALGKGIPVYRACTGIEMKIEPHATLEVLWPRTSCNFNDLEHMPVKEAKDQNGSSVALLLKLYGRSLLLAGDMEAASEKFLLNQLQEEQQNKGPVDLLKLSHHGSRTSTTEEWLQYWQPAAAFISVGRTNTYGHPHPTVTERLDKHEVLTWRTDQHGEIQIKIRDNSMKLRTGLDGRLSN